MAISLFHMSGSSPYTWGAPVNSILGQLRGRNHPHIHGEHFVTSPRGGHFVRITPIYMGSTEDQNRHRN